MRWKGIIFLVVLAVLVFVLNLVFTDRWLEKRLESAGSAVVGAKVELERLDFSLLGLQMRWDSLQVANPKNTMKNILTSGKTDFLNPHGRHSPKSIVQHNLHQYNDGVIDVSLLRCRMFLPIEF